VSLPLSRLIAAPPFELVAKLGKKETDTPGWMNEFKEVIRMEHLHTGNQS